MKVLYYDCFAGISGDMHLGAMIDLGVSPDHLRNELSKLKIDDEFSLVIKREMKNGISGTKVDVVLTNDGHTHSHHHHDHDKGHHHHERNFRMIQGMIEGSDLSDKVKKISLDIFYEVAQAEGKVHGKSFEEVHFHEVGAVDSIVDVVGSAICLEALEIDKIMASPVELGGGFVMCAHGKIPVPAPATVEILKGIPCTAGLVKKEMTTPTGAAILKAVVETFTEQHSLTVEKIGYGLGSRTLEVPNVLRTYIGKLSNEAPIGEKSYEEVCLSSQYMVETNIDDMSGELYQFIEERLFAVGALDVYKTPIIMKKGRPAIKLSILIRPRDREEILSVLFKETTSGGVREYPVTKHMMTKKYRQIETPYGPVQVKDFYYQSQLVKSKAEYEDCARLARINEVTIQEMYRCVEETERK